MSHSKTNIVVGAALNLLKACNAPYIQPLVDVALHIYNIAETLKTNKQDAVEVAERVGNAVCKIVERHSEECCTSMQQDDIDELLAYNHSFSDDPIILTSTSGAFGKLKFSSELSRIAHEHGDPYAVYTLNDIELLRVVKLGPVRHEVGHIAQCGSLKTVLVRRYTEQSKKEFLSDIKAWSKLTHPNFLFIGASPPSSPTRFLILDKGKYQHAREFFDQIKCCADPQEIIKHAITLITDYLAAISHWSSVGFKRSAVTESALKYNGHKMVIDLEPPRTKPTRQVTRAEPPFSKRAELRLPDLLHPINWDDFDPKMFNSIEDEVEDITSLMSLPRPFPDFGVRLGGQETGPSSLIIPDQISVTGPLWPLWSYFHDMDYYNRLFEVTQSIRSASLDTGISAPGNISSCELHSLLLAHGHAPYFSVAHPQKHVELGDVGYFDGEVFIKVTNILRDLRSRSIIGPDILFFRAPSLQPPPPKKPLRIKWKSAMLCFLKYVG
ncbi:hypothetical protein BDZ94DRAFT_1308578 [Collybia nuda]|uniref:Uncharacterized protein n=1 Tax=Collybia nuda TaxID=64659 RepID=A0A9P6CIV1_9AGAR|nr:hypothetical protein BDZ94DRAFT_1308578 [Collybia nuda]